MVQALVNPNALHEPSFVSVLVYVETKAVLEAMRMILQRGRRAASCSAFQSGGSESMRSKERPTEAEAEIQNDGVATELSVSQ